jgi:serine/threonine protein kinase
MTLIIKQYNVMQVFEFREMPGPMIIMTYYPDGNITDNIMNEELHVTAFGQILDGLTHLHAAGVAHRDLKPENFLVKIKPFFKVVISDFGLAKIAAEDSLLTTFCGTPKYLAPEVFPGLSDGHDLQVDVWSLGVIILEWIYGIPTPPPTPKPERKGTERRNLQKEWYDWLDTWCTMLLKKLNDEDDGLVVEILHQMIKFMPDERWLSLRCLARGFENGLFRRRAADGLVACAISLDDPVLPPNEGDDGIRTLTAATSSAGIDPEATIILGNLWVGGGSGTSR